MLGVPETAFLPEVDRKVAEYRWLGVLVVFVSLGLNVFQAVRPSPLDAERERSAALTDQLFKARASLSDGTAENGGLRNRTAQLEQENHKLFRYHSFDWNFIRISFL